jgi:hypothetical protein
MQIGGRQIKSSQTPIKRNIASLVGGVVIAVGCFILWMLVATQLTATPFTLPLISGGVLVALAVGIWIRLADL